MNDQKDRLFSYILYVLKNREDAKDVLQEVFLKMWEHWDEIRDETGTGWLIRVAHNQCIDWLRKHKTGRRTIRKVHGPFEPVSSDQEEQPDYPILASEAQMMLMKAMDQLPVQTREMLLLHYFYGLTYQEIGRILETHDSQVKVSVHRGRKKLREIWEKWWPEEMEYAK